jgi:6-phosphogluconolactonase
MTSETLLDKVPVNKNQVFLMFKEGLEPGDYAKEYEKKIRNVWEMKVSLILFF